MKDYYLLNRETVVLHHTEFSVTTHSADTVMWHAAYTKGYREPNYPLPVPVQTAALALPLYMIYDYYRRTGEHYALSSD